MEVILASLGSAAISAAAAIIVGVLNSNANNKKMMNQLEKRDDMHDYRIQQLEKKVDKHNNLIERTYELEKRTDLQEEKIRVANHRINDLEAKK